MAGLELGRVRDSSEIALLCGAHRLTPVPSPFPIRSQALAGLVAPGALASAAALVSKLQEMLLLYRPAAVSMLLLLLLLCVPQSSGWQDVP